jgi:hypothetical protein
MPVIGYLSSTSLGPYLAVYRQGLTEMGYVEGAKRRDRIPLRGGSH